MSQVRNTLYNTAKILAKPFGIYPFPGSYRRHLLNLLNCLQVNYVLDVGAHYGEWGSLLRDIGYRGTIISFEPVRASFDKLQATAAHDPGWRTYNYALGDADTTQQIHLYNASDFNSFLQASSAVDKTFPHSVEDRGVETVTVRRLETVLPEWELNTPRIYLKLDTQGYDKNVVLGAASALQHVVGMQSEIPGIRPMYDGQPNMLEILSYYHSLGYAPTGFFPINTESDRVTVIEFDVVLTRFEQPSGK